MSNIPDYCEYELSQKYAAEGAQQKVWEQWYDDLCEWEAEGMEIVDSLQMLVAVLTLAVDSRNLSRIQHVTAKLDGVMDRLVEQVENYPKEPEK